MCKGEQGVRSRRGEKSSCDAGSRASSGDPMGSSEVSECHQDGQTFDLCIRKSLDASHLGNSVALGEEALCSSQPKAAYAPRSWGNSPFWKRDLDSTPPRTSQEDARVLHFLGHAEQRPVAVSAPSSTEKSFGNDVEDTWVGFGGSSEEGQDVEEGVKTSLGLPAPSHTCIDNGLGYRGGAREGLWAAAGAESGGAKEQRQFSFTKSSTCCLLCVRRCVLHRYLTLLIPVKINVHYFIFRVMEMFEEIEANAFLKSMKNINLYVQEFE